MAIEKVRTQVISGIWQGIAQSGVDLSCVPQAQQEKLVQAVANQVLVTMNAVFDEEVRQDAPGSPADVQEVGEPEDELAEKILWQARPFLSLDEAYVLTNERIKIIRGLVSRRVENYELVRVQDIDFKQNVGERMLGIGDIFISGHDASAPKITLRDIHNPEEVYEILRRAWMEARKRHGLQFREYM